MTTYLIKACKNFDQIYYQSENPRKVLPTGKVSLAQSSVNETGKFKYFNTKYKIVGANRRKQIPSYIRGYLVHVLDTHGDNVSNSST